MAEFWRARMVHSSLHSALGSTFSARQQDNRHAGLGSTNRCQPWRPRRAMGRVHVSRLAHSHRTCQIRIPQIRIPQIRISTVPLISVGGTRSDLTIQMPRAPLGQTVCPSPLFADRPLGRQRVALPENPLGIALNCAIARRLLQSPFRQQTIVQTLLNPQKAAVQLLRHHRRRPAA